MFCHDSDNQRRDMTMRYLSTRGEAVEREFSGVLLTGLAEDGGLWQPAAWPRLDEAAYAPGADYAARAFAVTRPFTVGGLKEQDWRTLLADVYAGFRHKATAPLVQLDTNLWLMELFHGPTFAFKDLAMQVLGRLFDLVLKAQGTRITIIGATSGDTGAAAVEAVRGLKTIDLVMLYPHGRISDVQRRQMTTVEEPNIHTIALEGTFDDCQDLVKILFADTALREEWRLAAVNSINWARVMVQTVYYVHAVAQLGGGPVSFAVPSGNFGNVYAGYAAREMGLDARRFIVGSNSNDILARFFEAGDMSTRPVTPTHSPSMDIQVSSNFERLLHDLLGRDGPAVVRHMAAFRQSGRLPLDEAHWREVHQLFRGHAVNDDTTLAQIARTQAETGMTVDPHTAVGIAAACALRDPDMPTVALATAHPAKFPDAVEQATGRRPPLPDALAAQAERPERATRMPNDPNLLKTFIRERVCRP